MTLTLPDNRNVLTIRQPWAFLIIRPDLIHTSPAREAWLRSRLRKDIENRGSRINYRGPLWIHASQTFDFDGWEAVSDSIPELKPALMGCTPGGGFCHTGGIIGRVEVVDCVQHSPSLWFSGPHGWVLEDPLAVPFEKLRGFPGVFKAGQGKPPQTSLEKEKPNKARPLPLGSHPDDGGSPL